MSSNAFKLSNSLSCQPAIYRPILFYHITYHCIGVNMSKTYEPLICFYKFKERMHKSSYLFLFIYSGFFTVINTYKVGHSSRHPIKAKVAIAVHVLEIWNFDIGFEVVHSHIGVFLFISNLMNDWTFVEQGLLYSKYSRNEF